MRSHFSYAKRRSHQGFTLVEALIVVVLIAIIAAIAMPMYGDHVRESYRSDAKMTLQQGTQFMERYRADNNGSYASAVLPTTLQSTAEYNLSFTAAPTANAYTIQAVPKSGGSMATDTCGTYTVDHTQRKTAATVASGAVYDECW